MSGRSLRNGEILELLATLALRPHHRCLYRVATNVRIQARHASSSSHPQRTNIPPRPLNVSRPAPQDGAPVSLHVGLDRNPESVSAISRIPIPRGVRGEKFTPSELARPLGLRHPPRPGQNSPIDKRTWAEKRSDFASPERALTERRIYLRSYFRPYFQDWRGVDHHKGKSFVSNPKLFRRDKALYFPNIWGSTLAKEGDGPDGGRDTTPALMGKVSVIGVQSAQWAEEQTATFLSKEANPLLEDIITDSNGMAQRVDLNMQGDWIRALLVQLFKNRLRAMIPKDRWNRYFMLKLPRDIRPGLTEDVRDAMGILNPQVGYVYVVDSECKIRWAGSGHAWDGEVAGMNAAIQRLIQEETQLRQAS